jgi:hypothetical protein
MTISIVDVSGNISGASFDMAATRSGLLAIMIDAWRAGATDVNYSVEGVAATRAITEAAGSPRISIGYFNDPPTPATTTYAWDVGGSCYVLTLLGAVGNSPIRATGVGTASSSSPSVTVVSLPGDMVIGALGIDTSTANKAVPVVQAPAIGITDFDNGSTWMNAGYVIATGTSTTINWLSAPKFWDACAISIKPLVGGGAKWWFMEEARDKLDAILHPKVLIPRLRLPELEKQGAVAI